MAVKRIPDARFGRESKPRPTVIPLARLVLPAEEATDPATTHTDPASTPDPKAP